MVVFGKFPQSARREPPSHPRRCSDGSLLSGEEGYSITSMVGDNLNPRTRPYYFRRCKRVRPTHIESLPNELLSDILVRLPADHLYDRARLVCRRWYHIIHSYDFVNTQFQHSTYGLLLSIPRPLEGDGCHPILITATQGGRIEISEFSYLCRSNIFISCDGLGVELYCDHTLHSLPYIINPATRQSFVLPSMCGRTSYRTQCGIAFAPRSMKYKLTLPYHKPQLKWGIAILTYGVDSSWRDVVVDCVPERYRQMDMFDHPLFTEGFLHWTRSPWTAVLTLDMETEMLTVSKIPFSIFDAVKYKMYYLSTGRFLSLFVGNGDFSWEIWGMKSETGEWRKVLPDIDLGAQKRRLRQLASAGEDQVLEPVGWVKYPEVLALCFHGKSRTCIIYNVDTHEINSTELPYSRTGYTAVVHKNNLRWLI